MHFQYVCQPATSTTPREWKVKDLEWYRAYREVVFKQLEDAAEEGATGLDAEDGSEILFLSVLDMYYIAVRITHMYIYIYQYMYYLCIYTHAYTSQLLMM